MQKNWYAVYTKPQYEKKVSLLLTKKRIENFCPLNSIKMKSFRRNKFLLEPLFKSYVFVKIHDGDIDLLKQIDGVISLLYWMGSPAIIREDEIETIKEFTNGHQNLELERTQVDISDMVRIIDGPSYSIEGKVLALKNKNIKVNLPSLGYTIVAKIEDESIFGRETTILQNNSFSHS
jgi:transcription antitermination factor NusG